MSARLFAFRGAALSQLPTIPRPRSGEWGLSGFIAPVSALASKRGTAFAV